ncbi:ScbR family autoregulator-binding transcription factor [Streptomyces bullii]|uniref:ScbR family autoregulator-binding transcription factor n=1 Tax=Streptomyces bullii TaxID=349910 RepID=A0ABW0UTX9_9ACTN
MVTQERAERTRQRLLQAAAAEFSLYGYGGTSLQRISAAAGVTMGALTFHFPTKLALAEAVHAHGSALTRTAVARAHDGDGRRLQQVIAITHVLARLLHEEATVRAAGRLTRERTLDQGDWHDCWLPRVRELLEQASKERELRPGVDPQVMALLTHYLVSGLEEAARPDGGCPEHRHTLGAVWDLVLAGVADPAQLGPRTRGAAR